MPVDGANQPKLTVGSLMGVPLGVTPSDAGTQPSPVPPPALTAPTATSPAPSGAPTGGLTTEERPWSLADGTRTPQWERPRYRPDGVEAITYSNVFNQALEQVWFDGKVIYALDAGEVDVDPARVQVAQEYQIVYAVDLDERGKKRGEPERVPGQLNIYDTVPGMEGYSPIWQFNYVVVPRDFQPNTLRSEGDCLNSGYQIIRSNDFEN
jgi:hypothetical protein